MKRCVNGFKFVVSALAGAFSIVLSIIEVLAVYIWLFGMTMLRYPLRLDEDVETEIGEALSETMLRMLDPALSGIYGDNKDSFVAAVKKEIGV